jgi:hypothetical protein
MQVQLKQDEQLAQMSEEHIDRVILGFMDDHLWPWRLDEIGRELGSQSRPKDAIRRLTAAGPLTAGAISSSRHARPPAGRDRQRLSQRPRPSATSRMVWRTLQPCPPVMITPTIGGGGMGLRRTFSTAVIATALATVTLVMPAPGGAQPIARTACSQDVSAIIGGAHKCLGPGEYCATRYERQYERYGFICSTRYNPPRLRRR